MSRSACALRPVAGAVVCTALTALVVAFAVPSPLAAQPLRGPQEPPPIRGFPPALLAEQVAREQQARRVPSPDSLRARMRLLSEDPHEAGSERSRKVAELILARFRAFGLDAQIERFEALMPVPVSRSLELVAPATYRAALQEPILPDDKDSGDPRQLPTYNAYSADGDVTAGLVYVNYGTPEDYRVLDSLGVSVEGKIVLARYGRSWRGIKAKVAAERGAIGCIIYSDPEDDGYVVDDVYPEGPMRPWFGVQRGSVMDMPTYPGDPLSPGWASEEGARKLAISEAATLVRIPVLPIAYQDALPLLRHLGGPVAPAAWRGALPVTYHVGPGPAIARLALSFEWESRPLYNVIARIPGARWPDQWIVYGNHHDAWVNGAEDPISGMVALEETARSIAALLKTGWRPARTIVFAAWDGEEWGLLGSTEWAEKHRDELADKGAVYLGSDTNSRGWLGAGGSHSLQTFVEQVARDIHDPTRGTSVLGAWLERRRESREAGREGRRPACDCDTARTDTTVRFTIGALGSGSDYTAFLDHVTMATLNASYGGGQRAGIYHSIYDSFDFYRRFLDPSFEFGVMEAQTLATAILRLADAPILPFEFGSVAETYRRYVDEIEREARGKDAVMGLDLGSVRAVLDRLEDAAGRFESLMTRLDRLAADAVRSRAAELAQVNRLLYQTERRLRGEEGLPGRPWFKHLIYAPGYYTGYGVKTMPGIREAVEDRPDLEVATREAARVAAAILAYAEQVEQAAARLEEVLPGVGGSGPGGGAR